MPLQLLIKKAENEATTAGTGNDGNGESGRQTEKGGEANEKKAFEL